MTYALIGGTIIGIAASLMLVFNGRITGISGILSGVLRPMKGDTLLRSLFLVGLLIGGLILRFIRPESFESLSQNMSLWDYVVAGLLVGYGTLLGNGCTSGHGVCGNSRLSFRSMVATITFITFGVISVAIFKILRGEV